MPVTLSAKVRVGKGCSCSHSGTSVTSETRSSHGAVGTCVGTWRACMHAHAHVYSTALATHSQAGIKQLTARHGTRYGTRYGAHLVRHHQPAQVEVVALLGQQVAELPHLNGPTAVAY